MLRTALPLTPGVSPETAGILTGSTNRVRHVQDDALHGLVVVVVSDIGEGQDGPRQAYAYLLGIVTTMIGLVRAGPWLTMVGSRLLARRAGRPVALIAARRLGDDPASALRLADQQDSVAEPGRAGDHAANP